MTLDKNWEVESISHLYLASSTNNLESIIWTGDYRSLFTVFGTHGDNNMNLRAARCFGF